MDFPNQLAVLAQAVALSRVGGDAELLQEMAQIFLEECPVQMEAVREAVRNRDAKALERSAHSLKGSVGNFGAAQTQETAYRLEMMGRKGNIADAENALQNLEQALTLLQPEMENLALNGVR
ncbi:MAG: Hpt domain-containing protein [Candidatus Solibacter usitatus]|nr:Hpt domain-containing protein [Candidatus Solibacter usitatus]